MRALVYTALQSVAIQDVPRTAVAPGYVEIAVEYAGICGSDISGFLGHSPRRQPPLVLGHELVGFLANGKRVVANPLVSCNRCAACLAGRQNLCRSWFLLGMDRTPGAFADFVTLPETQVVNIPDAMPATQAVLAEPLANIVHLLALSAPQPFFSLAIVGGGTMGALILLAAKRLGARSILVADLNAERLNVLKGLGATTVADLKTDGGQEEIRAAMVAGFDLVVDASGAATARQMAFDLCRPGGQVALLGMGSLRSEVDFVTSIRKEHRVIMSFAYTPADFERSVDLLVRGEIDISPFVEQLPLEEGQAAFNKITHSPGAALKMMLSLRH
jgi:2-desacetyl-2-hydroxyethyl bacteriochlorophyllide A dehydrogenase